MVELVAIDTDGERVILAQSAMVSETKVAFYTLKRWHLSTASRPIVIDLGVGQSTMVMLSLFFVSISVVYALIFGRISIITVSSGRQLTVVVKPALLTRPIKRTLGERVEVSVIKRGVLPQWCCLVISSEGLPVEVVKSTWRESGDLEDAAQRLRGALAQDV
jgi:hypothetical protein